MKGVDTNVLVRYITRDDASQERAASRFVDAASARSEPIFVNILVLCELAWVLGRSYEYSRAAVAAVIERLLTTEQVIVEDAELVWLTLADFKTSKADFADCLIGRTNLQLGCDATATFDGRLKGIEGFEPLPTARPGARAAPPGLRTRPAPSRREASRLPPYRARP
jgi:predicted nucleic-acid-binding protein